MKRAIQENDAPGRVIKMTGSPGFPGLGPKEQLKQNETSMMRTTQIKKNKTLCAFSGPGTNNLDGLYNITEIQYIK